MILKCSVITPFLSFSIDLSSRLKELRSIVSFQASQYLAVFSTRASSPRKCVPCPKFCLIVSELTHFGQPNALSRYLSFLSCHMHPDQWPVKNTILQIKVVNFQGKVTKSRTYFRNTSSALHL